MVGELLRSHEKRELIRWKTKDERACAGGSVYRTRVPCSPFGTRTHTNQIRDSVTHKAQNLRYTDFECECGLRDLQARFNSAIDNQK